MNTPDYDTLWDIEKPVTDFDIDVPAWIEQDIAPSTVASILQGGCASGAYMPAVTYHSANNTMADHGDDVLSFIEDSLGELPAVPSDISWSGLAVHYLSCAVEVWASGIEMELCELVADDDDEATQ